ncbi:MAG: IS110 family transposase [Flavobacteriales bacterium]|jgi:transposase|nr:IS110 family transposase [Flavobacteriales bacterium]MBK6755093.1 IS110 family transposase [Flavobacteriales bacterium]MBK7084122.1 IS110 family transposase [Flavobacteriales bacterium]MBK9073619.1 IS110 family transposase [Flavobacteriales bacterium]MBK9073992.1 IS110 family transposase [Flavobacteriales bacterium]
MDLCIGIDVSKAHLDLALMNASGAVLGTERITNESKAIRALLKRWHKQFGVTKANALFCLEPTGHYGYLLVEELMRAGLPTWLAHPLDIKHSIGSTRGKNDRIDAQRIADYARRHHDKARLLGPGSLRMNKLKQLLTCRRQLVTDKRRHQVRIKDLNRHVDRSLRALFDRLSQERIEQIDTQLEKIEAAIVDHIHADPRLREQYVLLLSVDGVGPVLAAHLLACTEGFTRFATARRLACQAGVAPYEHSSGSSIHGRTRVSPQADRVLKTLLHMAALGVIARAGELQDYYKRKRAEGKAPMLVINAVRCKILHRLFAVVQRGTPFVRTPLAQVIE